MLNKYFCRKVPISFKFKHKIFLSFFYLPISGSSIPGCDSDTITRFRQSSRQCTPEISAPDYVDIWWIFFEIFRNGLVDPMDRVRIYMKSLIFNWVTFPFPKILFHLGELYCNLEEELVASNEFESVHQFYFCLLDLYQNLD